MPDNITDFETLKADLVVTERLRDALLLAAAGPRQNRLR